MHALISIGICTLRRPNLARTLASIRAQKLPKGTSLEVVVIDNDQGGSARAIVGEFAAAVSFEVRYEVEPQRGLSNARNRVLLLARGDWIALIDDDEVAGPGWLIELLSCAQRFEAQCVVGRVCPQYEREPAGWIEDSGFFDLWLPATGTRIGADDALSGNALLNAHFLRSHSLKFDSAFNATGGEDTDFFARLLERGGTIMSSREAVVHEFIGCERMTSEYMIRRSLRMGEVHARVSRREGFARGRQFARAILYTCAAVVLLAVHLPFGKRFSYRYRLALARNVGKLRYHFGVTPIEMYGSGYAGENSEVHANG